MSTEERYEQIKSDLLACSSSLATVKKQYKEISTHFSDLCEEKLRLETILFEKEGKVKHIPSSSSSSLNHNSERVKAIKKKQSDALKEYDEVQQLLRKLGVGREGDNNNEKD